MQNNDDVCTDDHIFISNDSTDNESDYSTSNISSDSDSNSDNAENEFIFFIRFYFQLRC